ncbi:HPP family protein [Belliella sp. DSM 111904]|uniref:HPP family protein n=1 Tax=Belliella filtrata TaxID=2923435 RepID=A0ABS9UYD8_9BACT|nr:HPP family protein [Belliella filtrata]MCH7409186.1 HPP family protein [Belliella filtrata]
MLRKKISRSYRLSKYVFYKETLVDLKENFWSFVGSFIGLGIIAFIQDIFFVESDNLFLIGSFGASSVLVYGVIQSPLSQPRNLLGGHLISALVGVSIYQITPDILWLSAPLAVSFAIIAMQLTKTLHPPGGATALIAVTGSSQIKDLGYAYVFFPVLSGVLILFFVALVVNNATSSRKYPNERSRWKIRGLLLSIKK